MLHKLKSWPTFYGDVCTGKKTFEIRYNDRDYRVGDIVEFHEWLPEEGRFTGRYSKNYCITYLTSFPTGLKEGFCVFGIGNLF